MISLRKDNTDIGNYLHATLNHSYGTFPMHLMRTSHCLTATECILTKKKKKKKEKGGKTRYYKMTFMFGVAVSVS